MSEAKKATVRAAERALDILLCFADASQLGMMEIAEKTGLNKSTVFRLLATLEAKGFVKRDPQSEKYRLGFRVWELSANLDQSDDPAVLFLPEMERLRDELDETVSLYIRDGGERVRIQAVESRQAIRRVAPVGARMPLAVGASSKVLMAYAGEEAVSKLLSSPDWPENLEREQYLEQLQKIREEGFAISVEEREAGTAAVSVPVFSKRGDLVAALAVSGPVSRMNIDKMIQFVPRMKEAAVQMGKMIRS
ncbi:MULTISPECIES: IclR family transcriptional regulator [Thermoactinomyces]|uniref:Glycerol operon regulatory protein n=1 Tax=Thermoactinomyces daqus TaxID=1329516 RepID=A0A7W1X9T6_9BACL|nr:MULTISPECIES: IclR family transcriptional regulator [Thermoactinomyces]MBA4542755.1 IclR family transcriptional regulator [Thermoactinomyces daqus]MBH8598574.1 IclR family transcriptional regulator [Thermoactinomyces sp. CICC 10523]MBH8604582.1 IclR family transcriptional regulator [Thermoactinomyces sp. CICC 10522]MBH8606958.1 IclR family transcriptional regulator [Thermoactinomyces sp. CICC 10521]